MTNRYDAEEKMGGSQDEIPAKSIFVCKKINAA
jgi:hypothetical protein